MVLIHLKQPDGDEFLYEAPSADTIENVATELATIHNMRLKLRGFLRMQRFFSMLLLNQFSFFALLSGTF
jgi:hypothetical protein